MVVAVLDVKTAFDTIAHEHAEEANRMLNIPAGAQAAAMADEDDEALYRKKSCVIFHPGSSQSSFYRMWGV